MPIKVREAEFRAVYEKWCVGRLTQAEAAAQSKMGIRTFGRYVARFRTRGSRWWDDRSGHRPSSHPVTGLIQRREIEALVEELRPFSSGRRPQANPNPGTSYEDTHTLNPIEGKSKWHLLRQVADRAAPPNLNQSCW